MLKGPHTNDECRILLFKLIPSFLLALNFFFSKKAFSINTEGVSFSSGNIFHNATRFNGVSEGFILNVAHLGKGYRIYSKLTFRFNRHDSKSPFGNGGINPYLYCIGGPVNFTDPTGHTPVAAIVGIIAGASGMFGNASTAWVKISSDKKYSMRVPVYGFMKSLTIGSTVLSVASISMAITSLSISDNREVKSALAITSAVTGILGVVSSFVGFKAMKRVSYLHHMHVRGNRVRYIPGGSRSTSGSNSDFDGFFFLGGNGWNMDPLPLIQPHNNINIGMNSIDSGIGNSISRSNYPRRAGVAFTPRDDSGVVM